MDAGDIIKKFKEAQFSAANHLKISILIKKALENDESGSLLDEFSNCLYKILVYKHKAKNIYTQRLIDFLCTFCKLFKPTNDTDHPILEHILNILIQTSSLDEESCRYWSCLLLHKILDNLPELGMDLLDQISDAMIDRLKDPKAVIRLEAVIAVHRLQDVENPEDEIIDHFCNILQGEPNAKVRQACVEKIALTKKTLPLVLERIRDVNHTVRLAAVKKIASKAKYLTIAQKRMVLWRGIQDSDKNIKEFVSGELVEMWFELYHRDFLKLMKMIRLDACEDDIEETVELAEFVLNTLFKKTQIDEIVSSISLSEEKLIDYKDLSWDSVLYYRIMVEFFRQSEDYEEALNTVLPELVGFCKYIRGYCDFIEGQHETDQLLYEFTLKQFFLIVYDYDTADRASRESLNSLIHHILQKVTLSTDVTKSVVKNLEKTIQNVKDKSIFVCEIISNLLYGEEELDYEDLQRQELNRQHSIQQLKCELMSLNEDEQQCIIEKRFLDADNIKSQIENKRLELATMETKVEKIEEKEHANIKTDPKTLIKCLTVAEALLLSPTITSLNPALATLNKELIEKVLTHEDKEVKARAFKCYCLCCLVDKRSALYGIHIFSVPIFVSGDMTGDGDIRILIICIKAVVDLLRLYGLSLVEKVEAMDGESLSDSEPEDERKVFVGGTSLTDLLQGLANLLEHENSEVQETSTKGVCLLLLEGRILSASLFSRIVLKWASPATDNERLKQFIGYTLEALPRVPKASTYFVDGILTTIRTLVGAPQNSPLSDVDVENIIKFMVTLCQTSPQESTIMSELALKICSQMTDKPRSSVNFFYAKTLLLLTVPDNVETLEDLVSLCDQLEDVVGNKYVKKMVVKFNKVLMEKKTKMTTLRPIEE